MFRPMWPDASRVHNSQNIAAPALLLARAATVVVQFELSELYYWLELNKLYYKWDKVHKVKNANNIEFERYLL